MDLINFLLRLFNKIFNKILVRMSGSLFCAAFNLRAFILGREIRLKFDSVSGKYSAIDNNLTRIFYHTKQGNLSYEKGFKDRAKGLSWAYMLDKIDFVDDDVIIDCGANVGDLGLFFIYAGKKIKYYGIEPSPLEFECLAENMPKGININVGLWSESKELQFYVSSEGADSSLIEPCFYNRVVSVKACRFDGLYSNLKIKLLKLEAEGAEPEVLEGFGSNLENIEWIAADLGYERGLRMESTFSEVTNYLLKRDFELVDFNPQRVSALYKNSLFNKV
jgi:FkbM family methyltransferase